MAEEPAPMTRTVMSTTHLLWVGRWVEVREHLDGWLFKTGRDAADWLLYPRQVER